MNTDAITKRAVGREALEALLAEHTICLEFLRRTARIGTLRRAVRAAEKILEEEKR